jgi:hypothetical protein
VQWSETAASPRFVLVSKERTYQETLDSWRTSCPRLPVWEDALERGLLERVVGNGRSLVRATSKGLALLSEKRSQAHVTPHGSGDTI